MSLENFNLLKQNLPPIQGSYFNRIKAENRRWEFVKILHEYLLMQKEFLSKNPDISPTDSIVLFKKLVSSFWEIVSNTNPNYWEGDTTQTFKEWEKTLEKNLQQKEINIIKQTYKNNEIPSK